MHNICAPSKAPLQPFSASTIAKILDRLLDSFLEIYSRFSAEPFSLLDNVKTMQEPVRKRGDDQRCDADESQSRKQGVTGSENLGCG